MTAKPWTIPAATDIALMRVWSRLGVWFTVQPAAGPVDLELTIAQTAVAAPANERLFVMPATWLSARHMLVDARRLVLAIQQLDARASAVAGALLDLGSDRDERPDGPARRDPSLPCAQASSAVF